MENIKENVKCPCRWRSCKQHGDCVACREKHRNSKEKRLVACERVKRKR